MFINRTRCSGAAPDAERVSRPLPPDEGEDRPPLADIDPADLSESGRRARAEVLRRLRARKARRRGGLRAGQALVAKLSQAFAAWRRHVRTRAILAALDDRTLKDVGLTRADMENLFRAGRKPVG